MEYFEFRAMNTDVVLAADGDSHDLACAFEDARDLFNSYEARLSRFIQTSELVRLNQSNGAWFSASDDMYELVKQASDLSEASDGLFDVTVLDALENIGYDKSMDEIRVNGVTRAMRSPRRSIFDFGSIEFNAPKRAIRLVRGSRIDLGGIAKGWVAERVAQRLDEISDACAVSAGGDMYLSGLPQGETAWKISLEDPRDPERTLGILRIPSGAVATSSITRRRWQQWTNARHHLIDPRTGLSAETDWLSVTAITSSAAVAEVFAKALLIAGSKDAERIARRAAGIEFIAIDRQGKLFGSRNAKEFLDAAIEYA